MSSSNRTRRWFITRAPLVLIAATSEANAQAAGHVARIGYLDQGSASRDRPYFDAFRQGLHDLGWVERQNITIDARFAEGKTDRLPALAAALVKAKMDVIATASTPAALAAKRATTTIPIVIGFTADPVGSGIVESLSHPGGNITGWTHVGLELRAKYLELLREAVPDVTRFGVLWNPSNPVHRPSLKVIQAAADRLNVELQLAPVADAKDLEPTFATLAKEHVGGIVVFPDGLFIAQTARIVELAASHRLAAMYGVREYAAAGGLMTYGADLVEMFRLGASFVDKILKGARPADLPIRQPTKFNLVLNLKTARALRLTIPSSLVLRADQIIE